MMIIKVDIWSVGYVCPAIFRHFNILQMETKTALKLIRPLTQKSDRGSRNLILLQGEKLMKIYLI